MIKTVNKNAFLNKPLPEGKKYLFMALACTKMGCRRGKENYIRSKGTAQDPLYISETSNKSGGFPIWLAIILAIGGVILELELVRMKLS